MDDDREQIERIIYEFNKILYKEFESDISQKEGLLLVSIFTGLSIEIIQQFKPEEFKKSIKLRVLENIEKKIII